MRKIIIFGIIFLILAIVAYAQIFGPAAPPPGTVGLGEGELNDDTMYIAIEDSKYHSVNWNITEAEDQVYNVRIKPGRHFVFGGEIE